jgi:CubicO group peptidase (beta-lactamase class C family)
MRKFLIGISLIQLLCASVSAQGIPEKADKYFSARTRLGRFSGVVLVARSSEVLFEKGYGFADVEHALLFTTTTQLPIASLSKLFTAMAVLKLRDTGRLRLDDSICAHLSNCPDTWKPITIQDLLRHTSGIPDYEEALELGSDNYLQFMRQQNASEKIMENARKLPLDFPPALNSITATPDMLCSDSWWSRFPANRSRSM